MQACTSGAYFRSIWRANMVKVTLGQVNVSWEEGNTNHNHTVSTILIPQNEIVKLRSRSRSGEGQLRVRKVRDRSESGKAQLRT